MKKPVISFSDFSFKYHSQAEPTLKNINITIYEGEKVLIVGPSGSGKSTLAKCINGLIPQIFEGELQGTVTIGEQDIRNSSLFERSFDVGTVLQDTDGQFIGLTVAEDIAFALENDGVAQPQMQASVHTWASKLELETLLTQRPQELSGGQKQRVSIAGVLIDTPPILLFDEPLANLDPKTSCEMMEIIEKIHQTMATTIVMIEHRLEDVLCEAVDRIIVIGEGEIVADTTPDQLLSSNILKEQGIREPLYVTALKYAGVNLCDVQHLADLTKVKDEMLMKKLSAWNPQKDLSKTILQRAELLQLEEVSFGYNRKNAKILNQLSLKINRGEMVSLVGNNGAGKSTLCKLVCGFLQPQQGRILWEGAEFACNSIKERADKIGYVMQNPNQMISKKMIFEEVALGLTLRGVAPAEIEDRVLNILQICGLYPYRNWPISALSYGQKKRVTIASILVLEPDLLILDEPTAGQDFKHYTEMMLFLEKLNRLGLSILIVTHDMHLMLEYTTRALVMSEGKLLADTTPVAVLTNPQLVKAGSLKETSLFTLANNLQLPDPVSFVEKFVSYDREVRFK
ncbi:ABC transporter ATP-binding protein [Enterococcus faecalis]